MTKTPFRLIVPAGARSLIWLVLYVLTAVSLSAQIVQLPTRDEQIARLQQLFLEGNESLAKGNFQAAVQKYAEAIAVDPSIPLPYVNRGVAYLSLSKHAEAAADADRALSLMATGSHPPSHLAIAHQVKGTVYQHQGDPKLAIESFSRSIELEPSSAKFWNSRGTAYLLSREYDRGLKDFDKAIELDSAIPMFYINRATVRLSLKDLSGALKDLDEALKLNDTDSNAYYTRGNVQVKLSKLDEALKDYDRAISLKPKAPYHHARSLVYFNLGKYDLAIQDNSQALTLDPKNVNAFYARAQSYTRLAKYSLALDDIRNAIAVNEKSAIMRYSLAYLLFKTGKFAQAAIEASQVIELAPQWRSPYLLRSNAYAKIGNALKAKADRRTASTLDSAYKPKENNMFFELTVFVPEELESN